MVGGKEDEMNRSYEFLQSPPTRVPSGIEESLILRIDHVIGRDICEERVAHLGLRVPAKHGVDSFRQLSTTALVNAAGVDPNPSVTIALCYDATIPDLWRNDVAWVLARGLATFP